MNKRSLINQVDFDKSRGAMFLKLPIVKEQCGLLSILSWTVSII